MGTSKSGRYLNTEGAFKSVSDFALVHSVEGSFVKKRIRVKGKVKSQLRLECGGHGQKGMDLLDKYGIKYNIVKTFSNGVRVGNVPDHVLKSKRTGINQTWFPKSWTEKDIRRAGEHVVGLKKNRHIGDGKVAYGSYKGVRVGVIKNKDRIATVFPDSHQEILLKRKKKR